MSGIVEFLRARLDEDEAVARRAGEAYEYPLGMAARSGQINTEPDGHGQFVREGRVWEVQPADMHWRRDRDAIVGAETRREIAGDCYEYGCGPGDRAAEHIVRFDPARVLADVAAKRAMIVHVDYLLETILSEYSGPASEALLVGFVRPDGCGVFRPPGLPEGVGMSVRVSIDIGGGHEMDIDRPTTRPYASDPGEAFREAAGVLEGIAADIRRMYPEKPVKFVHPDGPPTYVYLSTGDVSPDPLTGP